MWHGFFVSFWKKASLVENETKFDGNIIIFLANVMEIPWLELAQNPCHVLAWKTIEIWINDMEFPWEFMSHFLHGSYILCFNHRFQWSNIKCMDFSLIVVPVSILKEWRVKRVLLDIQITKPGTQNWDFEKKEEKREIFNLLALFHLFSY